jgi:PKD repeat protein
VVGATVGQLVQKYGRTTGHTQGEVTEVNVTVNVCYETAGPFQCKSYAKFIDQIGIAGADGTNFSSGGDSGSLIVTDDGSNSPVGLLFAGSDTRTLANPIQVVLDRFNVTIDDGSGTTEPTNSPPTADFSYSATDLTVDFTDQSTDSDGSIASWAWDFGDGATSTAQNPSHTYDAAGDYNVSLTVTDNDGATDQTSQAVTVTTTADSDISLTANGYKVRGRHHIDLTWTGATTVDIYRDGSIIESGYSGTSYTDSTGNVGGGSYTYKVCEAGTATCSNEVTVTF